MPKAANPALMKPLKPSETLAAIIGPEEITRGQVMVKIWEYNKSNNLQNPQNKRNIIADAKLLPLFGGKKEVTMFEMTKLISAHLS